jgi:UDP-N-acetylmuramoylalanine--D-glutamate ligase
MRASGGTARAVVQIGGIGSLRGAHNAQNAACATARRWRSACRRRDPAGTVSFPGLAHRMEQVGAQGQRAVRQRLEGDQCGRPLARARSFTRHLLDRGRQGQDRRHHLARGYFPRIRKAYLIGEAAANSPHAAGKAPS